MRTDSTQDEGRFDLVAAGGLIALGLGLRLWLRTPTDFWEDEIIAATHAPLGIESRELRIGGVA